MARRRHGRFGAPQEVHAERAKSNLREIHRLSRKLRSALRSPPDCIAAAGLLRSLVFVEGAYLIDRAEGYSYRARGGRSGRGLFHRFLDSCVVKPKSAAAARRMRAV